MSLLSLTLCRRAVQCVLFVFFVAGGWLAVAASGREARTQELVPRQSIVWTQGERPILDVYLPGAVCRFTGRGKAVSGCILELLSESLTLAASPRTVLPYLLVFVATAFVLGRWWCGWACPLGTMGDFLNWLRVRAQRAYLRLRPSLQGGLRAAAYGLLAGTLGISWLIRPEKYKNTYQCWFFLPFCQICPARLACPLVVGAAPSSWGAFGHVIQGTITVVSWAVLGFFIASFLAARRLWCHLCPIGLIASWFNRGSAVELTKEAERCNRCGACADACPMGLTHVRDEKRRETMNTGQCILCLRCVEACPREKCLSFRFFSFPLISSRFRLRRPRAADGQSPASGDT